MKLKQNNPDFARNSFTIDSSINRLIRSVSKTENYCQWPLQKKYPHSGSLSENAFFPNVAIPVRG